MPRVPSNVQDLINFCAEHASVWTSPTTTGLTAAQVSSLKSQADDTANAVAEQLAARNTAKATTLTANTQVSTLRKKIAACIRSIVTFAEAQADPMAIFAA